MTDNTKEEMEILKQIVDNYSDVDGLGEIPYANIEINSANLTGDDKVEVKNEIHKIKNAVKRLEEKGLIEVKDVFNFDTWLSKSGSDKKYLESVNYNIVVKPTALGFEKLK